MMMLQFEFHVDPNKASMSQSFSLAVISNFCHDTWPNHITAFITHKTKPKVLLASTSLKTKKKQIPFQVRNTKPKKPKPKKKKTSIVLVWFFGCVIVPKHEYLSNKVSLSYQQIYKYTITSSLLLLLLLLGFWIGSLINPN